MIRYKFYECAFAPYHFSVLFYADYSEQTLMCIQTDGDNKQTVASGIQQIQGIAVDMYGKYTSI